MKYSVITFGCRVNQADSLGFEEDLLRHGATPATPEQADVIIVNTCSVTASADQGARQTIRRIARENPSAKIVVTGCYATRRPGEVAALPGVERVVVNDEKPQLVEWLPATRLVRHAFSGGAPDGAALPTAMRFGDGEGSCGAPIEPGVAGRTAFTLRVQTGCGESCSYCIIPSTRGAPRSVRIETVVRESERVASAGFKEMVLTGVHLGSYGRDLQPQTSLAGLLERLAGAFAGSDVRFRISSLEPMDCTPEVVALVEKGRLFAPHFHLPLQHASDRMLSAMRRPYTAAYYAALVGGIRDRLPDASIGSDVIVGFPGETAADFEVLADYLERSPLTHVHVFPYSDRPGTDAAVLGGKVDGTTIRDRARRVRAIASRLSAQFREQQIGTVHSALTLDDGTVALTGNYLKLRIPAAHLRNTWVKVRVTGAETAQLVA